MIKRIAPMLLFLAFLPLPLLAQQVGASVTGHVFDPSGAAVAGATIKLTSTTTGSVYTAGSSDAGIYQFPFVLIGSYTLSAEKAGFKKYEQSGIALLGGQKATVDITMQLGAVTQTVNVTANASILHTESGDRTATISNVRLDPQVFRGQNTIVTTWFTPGVTLTAGAQKIRPWDNAGTQAETINGGQNGNNNGNGIGYIQQSQPSGNQVMVDGVSVNRGGNGTGFNLMASAVDQVTVVGTLYDAQYGWSTGGHINTLSKGGSNQWHVHAYDYVQNTMFNARDWTAIQGNTKILPWHINMYGGEIGGPLKKDKIFVYYGYQMIWQVQRDPFTGTVPTAAMRQGNFNGVLLGGQQIQLYDPSTTATTSSSTDPTSCYYTGTPDNPIKTGANPCRSQTGTLVSGNQVLSVNPIASHVMSLIPMPYGPGLTQTCPPGVTASVCGSFAGNIFSGPSTRKFLDYFPEHTGRIDWNFSDRTKSFFRFSKNDLAETRSFVYSTLASINPAETSGNNPLFRGNQAYVLQVTHTFNPTTVLEFRTGMDRYPNGGGNSAIKLTDPASLGFSANWAGLANHLFPQIAISGFNGAGGTLPSYTASDIWSHEIVLAHTRGKHNIRAGYQRFDLAEYQEGPGNINGYLGFNGYFTNANPLGAVGSTGYSLADFELGMPIQAFINQPTYPEYWMHEHSFFVQDDYHVTRNFTLNLGLRWDYAGPVSDKYNRLLNGFCAECPNPLGYIPGLGNLMGGPTFAGTNGAPKGIFHRKFDNFGPRVGFAYSMAHNFVLRGGWGIVYGQQILQPGAAPGFSNVTSVVTVPGAAGIFNPNITLANLLPGGLNPISGSAFGLATNIGKSFNFPNPDMDVPRTQQYSLELQRSFGHNWIVSMAYVGSRAQRLIVNRSINYVPLSALPFTPNFTVNPSGYTSSQLSAQVTNPFAGNIPSQYSALAAGTYLNNATVSRSTLLLPYPQFAGGITELFNPIGTSNYNSMQFEVNKRFSYGLEFSSSLTWARTMQALGYANAQDPSLQYGMAPFDCPRQVKVNMAYFAPFGPGKKFLNSSGPVVSRLVEGWSLSATPMIMDGFPIPMPAGVMPIASPATKNPNLSYRFNTCWVDLSGVKHDCSGAGGRYADSTPAWQQMQSGQLIGWSSFMRGVRYVGVHRLDASIKKDITIKERYQLVYRADFINAFNSSEWNGKADLGFTSSTFGMVGYPYTTPSNDQRVIEMSLQLRF